MNGCGCKSQAFRNYEETLAVVNKDLNRNLDMIDVIRRLKMHGFALTSQLNKLSRKFISLRTVTQPLSQVKNFKPNSLWEKMEVLTQQDMIGLGLFKKLQKHFDKEEKAERKRVKVQTSVGHYARNALKNLVKQSAAE